MHSFIVLLRGINVSGHNIIKMEALKNAMLAHGALQVSTYIQSGNIVLKTPLDSADAVNKWLHDLLFESFNLNITVFSYDINSWKAIMDKFLLTFDEKNDSKQFYITFLSDIPASELQAVLANYDFGLDEYAISDSEMFINCKGGYGKTKLSNSFIESKLKVRATTRNWNTIHKLWDMINA